MRVVLTLGLLGFLGRAQAGCHDECSLYNPVNFKCVQKVQVCDPPSPIQVISDPAKALRDGYVQLNGDVKNLQQDVGRPLGDAYDRLAGFLSSSDFTCMVDAGFAVGNAYICVNDPSAPGTPIYGPHGETSDAGTNACAAAAVFTVLYLHDCAYGGPENDKNGIKLLAALNEPSLANAFKRTDIQTQIAAATEKLRSELAGGAPLRTILQSASVPVFTKHGNNGTVSCNTFCEGAQWGGLGQTGACLGASLGDQAKSCNDVPGFGAELTCSCSNPALKTGNNGSVSCNTYCAGKQWEGFSGACIAGFTKGMPVGCDVTPGFPNSMWCSCLKL